MQTFVKREFATANSAHLKSGTRFTAADVFCERKIIGSRNDQRLEGTDGFCNNGLSPWQRFKVLNRSVDKAAVTSVIL